MRIAIVAPGGVGGYFGGMLAMAGEDVVALARGAHLAAIQHSGLRVEGPRGDDTLRMDASDDARALGVADIVLFAVKLYQAEDAARAAAPLFGPRTLGISLLNGITGPDTIATALPGAIILPGCAYVSAVISAPGHIRYTGAMSSIIFGSPVEDEAARAKSVDFAERCRRAGFAAEVTDDARSALWTKLIGLATNAAMTTAARLPAGPLYSDPEILEVVAALIAEATAVARADGATLPDDIEEIWLTRLKGFPPGMYASTYHDIAKGGPLEVDGFSGHIVREGRRLSVPTPHHAALYAVLKPHRGGRPPLE
ncbi:ketopantoate reductase family protein [Falsiroseomonas sp. E2-1-a20]|uniref:ketopantoate reductase family protein n=1 Tax=Falsiroseomonas sp. E2-1-a20 TaxID=3239300 RepID=UPI003F2ECA0C